MLRIAKNSVAALLTALLAAALPLAGGCDRATTLGYDTPPPDLVWSIPDLKALCTGDYVRIVQDITVRGTVTANDHYGEFFRTIVVEDAAGAIRIVADHPRLSDLFPFGAAVSIRCNGLTLGRYGGRIVLGAEPDGAYGATRIPADRIDRHLSCEGQAPTFEAPRLTFDGIDSRHIDAYVRFDGVRFTEAARWCDADPETQRPVTTERTIADAEGRTFTVRTLGGCVYAEEPVPTGTGSLYGIIDYFNGRYALCVTARRVLFSAPTVAAPPTAYPSVAGY